MGKRGRGRQREMCIRARSEARKEEWWEQVWDEPLKSEEKKGVKGDDDGEKWRRKCRRIQSGNVPMQFSLYRRLSEYMLMDPNLESILARAFFTTTWNLISRATNTCTIHLHHME